MCDYYQNILTCPTNSGTSNLHNHLNYCKQFKACQDDQDHTKSQHKISKEGSLKSVKVSKGVLREATNEIFVLGQLPRFFIDSVVFKLLQ